MTISSDEQGLSPFKLVEAKIKSHPAFRAHAEHSALEATIKHVVEPNWREFLQLLVDASSNIELAIELVQNVRHSIVAEQFREQLDQRLHNYVASVFTLVEHVQKLKPHLPGEVIAKSDTRLLALLANPEIEVVKQLRIFTQHYRLPVTAHTFSIADMNKIEQSMSSEVQLVVGDLLQFSGWNSECKEWLRLQGAALDLRPLIEKHGKLFLKFNTELLNDFAEANKEGLEELNELVVDRQMALTGSDRDTARRVIDAITRRRAGEDVPIPGFEGFPTADDLNREDQAAAAETENEP